MNPSIRCYQITPLALVNLTRSELNKTCLHPNTTPHMGTPKAKQRSECKLRTGTTPDLDPIDPIWCNNDLSCSGTQGPKRHYRTHYVC
ncbi:hypothetical protein Pcinc_029670 [Petrolisthes cinctipes]|uniref:Uncharacterized protein n=1 Tax=Petrolisthes cinctipes TaxID=88211 RepID=A0AAE1EZU9_PETCI|nr:hypothetical protein Pcinc_029670 [Petrolisthes cinctipes]